MDSLLVNSDVRENNAVELGKKLKKAVSGKGL